MARRRATGFRHTLVRGEEGRMKRIAAAFVLSGLAVACLMASGCAWAYGPAFIPAAISVTATPIAAGPDQEGGTPAKGSATAVNVLGLFAFGNASIRAAMNDGGITKIKTVDAHMTNILGIYSSYTTEVTGH